MEPRFWFRRYSSADSAARVPWTAIWTFVLVLFLASWAGGLWISPFGPVLFGVSWLPFIFVAVIFGLLLAAVPPERPPRTPGEAFVQAEEKRAARQAFDVFFWILLIVLLLAVISGYYWHPWVPAV